MGYLVVTVDKTLTRVTLHLQYSTPQFPVPRASIRAGGWLRGQVPTGPRIDNFKMQKEERGIEGKGEEECHPKPNILSAESFSWVSIANPAPVLSHISVTNKENRCWPPYRIRNCIVFRRWVSVYTKPNSDKEDHEKEFNANGNRRDGSVELFKPPYCQEGLHSDGLQIDVLDELAKVVDSGLTSVAKATLVSPSCCKSPEGNIRLRPSGS
jgi:hypothetical protein